MPAVPRPDRPAVVLDTNVVLDWLFFRDPRCRGLDEAVRAAKVRWVGTPAMLNELEQVLTREPFSLQPDRVATVLTEVNGSMQRLGVAPCAPGAAGHCTDPDDQKFVDLVFHLDAPAQLISRDRAVLRLARVATRHGVQIVTIADWRPPSIGD